MFNARRGRRFGAGIGGAALGLMLLSGCAMGGLGQGTLKTSTADDAETLNAPLAVGASLQPDVRLQLQGSASPTLELLSARPDIAETKEGRIIARAPGVTAILVSSKEGTVLDFYHLWVEQANRVTLHRLDDSARDLGAVSGGLDLLVGESIYLTPKVYYDAQQLAGTVSADWQVEPPIALVLRQGVADRRRIVGAQAGEAKLTVQTAGISLSLPLRVLAAPSSPPPPPPPPPPVPPPEDPASAAKGGAA